MILATERMDQDHFLRAWQRFVSEGELMPSLSPPVVRSWFRCRYRKLNPYQAYYRRDSQFDQMRLATESRYLGELFGDITKELGSLLTAGELLFAVTDGQGRILGWLGNAGLLPDKFLGPGHFLLEEVVGTMAISLTLIEKKPFQIRGAEHYCSSYHHLRSYAFPLFLEREFIGALSFWLPLRSSLAFEATGVLLARLLEARLLLKKMSQPGGKNAVEPGEEGQFQESTLSNISWIVSKISDHRDK